jgi:hypothetical protein
MERLKQTVPDKEMKHNKIFQGFAITSLVIGVVMAGIMLLRLVWAIITMWTMVQSFGPSAAEIIGFFVIILGFVSGFIGLKSHLKKIAITGIILCALLITVHILPFIL